MESYSYKILDTNEFTHTMLVQYTPIDSTLGEINLNIPAPASLDNIEAHINTYAPQSTWYNVKNPNYQLSSLVGNENTVNPDLFVESNTASSSIAGGVYELMLQLNNEFLAEQSNTVSI